MKHDEQMRAKYGQELTDHQHRVVYDKAYDIGHAYGYEEVEHHYEELCVLASEILKGQTENG